MPVKYVPFVPEPIDGQAVLGNFNRILKYKGADDVKAALRRGMPLYEMEKRETVGENTDGNMVIRGECVSACAYLKEQNIQVDLVYIDPPFASGADYAKKVYVRRSPKVAQAIDQAERELDVDELKAFEEKMYGDVWDKEKYLNWMYENLMAIKSVMSETASIYVHLDYHIGHYVKILMDEVFGEDNFRNEIIWCYKTTLKTSDKYYGKDHDIILFYAKSNDVSIHPDRQDFPVSASTLKRWGEYADESGFVSNKHFAGSASTIINTEDESKGFNINNGIPRDWWEISANVAKGDTDEVIAGKYATQKPIELLSRIIKASSDENMLIADFFGGSGTTAVAANRLGRRFIHCDVGVNSIQTTRDRLKADGAEFDVLEVKDGVSLFRNPAQTMDKLKALIPGLKEEPSLGGFWAGAVSDSRLGTIPVYLPDLKDSASKLLDEVTMTRILHQAIPELDASVRKVIVYYVDLPVSEAEMQKFVDEDDSTVVKIELRDLKAVLDDVVVEDYAAFHVEEVTDNLLDGYQVVIDRFISDRVQQKIFEFNRKAMLNSGKKSFRPIEISEEGLELIEYLSLDCTAAGGPWHADSEIKIDKLGYVIRSGARTKEFWDGAIASEKHPLRLKIRNICGDETVWRI